MNQITPKDQLVGRWNGRGSDGVEAVEAEIMREKAEALGRAGRRLEHALEAFERVREMVPEVKDRLERCASSPEETASLRTSRADLNTRLRVLHAQAQQALQYLIIHREAVGMRNHVEVERTYRIRERLR